MTELINKYAKEIADQLSDNLEALILVGSYARGEEVEGISDIEFWAVVKDLKEAAKPSLDKNISLGFTTRNHLKRLKPYIYTIEVKKFGKVLYGDKNITSLIPTYFFEDIAAVDSFILLNNRLIEQMILLNRIEDGETINQYEFNKGYAQLVNAILVSNKRYRSLYTEKLEEFCKINNVDAGLRKKAEEALSSFKQQSGIKNNKDEAIKKWLELREYFRMLWLGEKRLFGSLIAKPLQLWIYYKASKLYFSDGYHDKKQRNNMIRKWEQFVK